MRASKTSGLWPVIRDRDLVRLGAAFADFDARLLAGEAPPGLSDTARNILYWLRVSDVAGLASVTIRRRLRDCRVEAMILSRKPESYRSAGARNHGATCAVMIQHRMPG
jgi:hypothetical protein